VTDGPPEPAGSLSTMTEYRLVPSFFRSFPRFQVRSLSYRLHVKTPTTPETLFIPKTGVSVLLRLHLVSTKTPMPDKSRFHPTFSVSPPVKKLSSFNQCCQKGSFVFTRRLPGDSVVRAVYPSFFSFLNQLKYVEPSHRVLPVRGSIPYCQFAGSRFPPGRPHAISARSGSFHDRAPRRRLSP